jgi:hypothetical protein
MIKLTQLLKESTEENRPLSLEVKKHFLEIVSTYNKYQESLDRKSDIQEIAETLGGITEAARTLAIRESGDWFDKHTVKRNMSELDKLGKQFDKVALEAKSLDQRMGGLYEDMGHILSRYYKMGEITEDQMKDRLGMNKSVNERYKGNSSDFKYDFEMALDNMGISGKAIKKISKKGKGYEVRLSSYMSDKKAWEKIGKSIGAELVDFKKGSINIGLYESVVKNESKSDCGCGCGGKTEGGCNG